MGLLNSLSPLSGMGCQVASLLQAPAPASFLFTPSLPLVLPGYSSHGYMNIDLEISNMSNFSQAIFFCWGKREPGQSCLGPWERRHTTIEDPFPGARDLVQSGEQISEGRSFQVLNNQVTLVNRTPKFHSWAPPWPLPACGPNRSPHISELHFLQLKQ